MYKWQETSYQCFIRVASVAFEMALSKSAIVGSILGTAVGDALGLPYEGLSPRRAARLFGEPTGYRLLPGRGMISDDTEHASMAMQALVASGDDVDLFSRQLARRIRYWLLALPAGTGRATLMAGLKLWMRFSPSRSGVFSAGNGPAMRSAVLGVAIDDLELLRRLVTASSRITHTDPKAEYGAFVVALAARVSRDAVRIEPEAFRDEVRRLLPDRGASELHALIERAVASVGRHERTKAFAASLGLDRGVTGYVYHTVPVALHAWLSHPRDYRTAVIEVIRCGGDADSTAGIVGGIVGAAVGKEGIPREWLNGLSDWPRSVCWLERLAGQLFEARTTGNPATPLRLPTAGLFARNLFFTAIVLAHGFRRLLPPY